MYGVTCRDYHTAQLWCRVFMGYLYNLEAAPSSRSGINVSGLLQTSLPSKDFFTGRTVTGNITKSRLFIGLFLRYLFYHGNGWKDCIRRLFSSTQIADAKWLSKLCEFSLLAPIFFGKYSVHYIHDLFCNCVFISLSFFVGKIIIIIGLYNRAKKLSDLSK